MSLALRIATRSSPTTIPGSITGWTRACLFSPRHFPADVYGYEAVPQLPWGRKGSLRAISRVAVTAHHGSRLRTPGGDDVQEDRPRRDRHGPSGSNRAVLHRSIGI